MSVPTFCFIEPLDVLVLRGNKLFGDPGSFGESLIPPWPSVAAGALRSAILAEGGIDFTAFAEGRVAHPELGTPQAPGTFALTHFGLARRGPGGEVETLHPLPADLEVSSDGGMRRVARLTPTPAPHGLASSATLPQWPVIARADRGKPETGCWLSQEGWAEYLAGRTPNARQVVASGELWTLDSRVGVGLDPALGRAADSQLFSVQAVALRPGVGFVAGVAGATLPERTTLRFGGDGRGAAARVVAHRAPSVDLQALARARRARLVLTAPGLFPDGWRPPEVAADGRLRWPGVAARLVCAAVPRAEVVSGWDLANRRPKPAERAAPAGSVYWLDELDASADALRKLAETGLWLGTGDDAARRAEGFNRFSFAAW